MKLFNEIESMDFFVNCNNFELLPEEILDHPTLTMNDLNPISFTDRMILQKHKKLSGYYFLLLYKSVTEKEVEAGIDDFNKFNIVWELEEENNINGINYVIFKGWGDRMHGGHRQFEGRRIGFPKKIVSKTLFALMIKLSDKFPLEKMQKIKEFEWLKIEINPITGGKNLSIYDV